MRIRDDTRKLKEEMEQQRSEEGKPRCQRCGNKTLVLENATRLAPGLRIILCFPCQDEWEDMLSSCDEFDKYIELKWRMKAAEAAVKDGSASADEIANIEREKEQVAMALRKRAAKFMRLVSGYETGKTEVLADVEAFLKTVRKCAFEYGRGSAWHELLTYDVICRLELILNKHRG